MLTDCKLPVLVESLLVKFYAWWLFVFIYGFQWLIGAEQARELCRTEAVWHQMSGERYRFCCRVPPQKENYTQRPQAWEHRATSHGRAGRQTELSYCKPKFIPDDFIVPNFADKLVRCELIFFAFKHYLHRCYYYTHREGLFHCENIHDKEAIANLMKFSCVRIKLVYSIWSQAIKLGHA